MNMLVNSAYEADFGGREAVLSRISEVVETSWTDWR